MYLNKLVKYCMRKCLLNNLIFNKPWCPQEKFRIKLKNMLIKLWKNSKNSFRASVVFCAIFPRSFKIMQIELIIFRKNWKNLLISKKILWHMNIFLISFSKYCKKITKNGQIFILILQVKTRWNKQFLTWCQKLAKKNKKILSTQPLKIKNLKWMVPTSRQNVYVVLNLFPEDRQHQHRGQIMERVGIRVKVWRWPKK